MSFKKTLNEQQLGILRVSEVFVLSAAGAGAGAGDVKGLRALVVMGPSVNFNTSKPLLTRDYSSTYVMTAAKRGYIQM